MSGHYLLFLIDDEHFNTSGLRSWADILAHERSWCLSLVSARALILILLFESEYEHYCLNLINTRQILKCCINRIRKVIIK